MITGILHASFISTDLTKSRAFYEGVLGLKINQNRPSMSYDGVWYNVAPNLQIHLLELPNPDAGSQRPVHGGRDRHVALAVTDITKLIARLDQTKISYTLSQSGRRALFCHDPDGNALEFIEIQ